VTEEIWKHFRAAGGAPDAPEHLIVAPIPDAEAEVDGTAIATVRALIDIVQGIRNARHESGVEPGRMIEARIVASGDVAHLEAERDSIERLARVDPLVFLPRGQTFDEPAVTVRAGGVEVYLPLAGMVDLEAERERLGRELEQARADLERADQLLANQRFLTRAPDAVVRKERDKAAAAQTAILQIEERLAALEG
jgi:valyl-tRNA synthetase